MTAGVLKPSEKYVHFNVPGAFSFVLAAFTGNVSTGLVNLQKSIMFQLFEKVLTHLLVECCQYLTQ